MKLSRTKVVRIQFAVCLTEEDAQRVERLAAQLQTKSCGDLLRRLMVLAEEKLSGPYPDPKGGNDAKPG